MKNTILTFVTATGLLLGSAPLFGLPVNITVQDNDNTPNHFGPTGVGNEDNETEGNTINTQDWDLEAFVLDGSTLHIVGGFNMQAGFGGFAPGDLVIKVGGTDPGFAPTTGTPATVDNSTYGYTYAVDLTQPVGATLPGAAIYSLTSSSLFDTVVYDQFGANPWRYNSGGTQISTRGISYQSGLTDAQVQALFSLAVPLTGGLHNVLSIDLGFLSATVGTNVYFSYTMECGNDSLKGRYSGGFDRVPDGAASLLLIGIGVAAMALVGLARRKS